MILYLYSLVLTMVFGVSLSLLLTSFPPSRTSALFILSSGVILGFCGMGALYGFQVLFWPQGYSIRFVFEALITAALVSAALRKVRFSAFAGIPKRGRFFPAKIDAVDFLALVFLVFAFGIFILNLRIRPLGEWDAFRHWNSKAKALAMTQGSVASIMHYGHSDYPLLLPYIIARFFQYAGALPLFIPQATAFFFYAAFAGMFASCIGLEKNRLTAEVALVLFLATPFFPVIFAWQYADGYVYALFTALLITWRMRKYVSPLMGGFFWGALIMIKNVGLAVLTPCFLVGFAALFIVDKGLRRGALKNLLKLAVATFPFLILYFAFKMRYSGNTPVIDTISSRLAQHLYYIQHPTGMSNSSVAPTSIIIANFIVVAKYIGKTMLFPRDYCFIPLFVLLVPCIAGRAPDWKKSMAALGIPFAMAFAGYFVAYCISPGQSDFELVHYLETVVNRITGHIMPLYYLLMFMVSKPLSHSPG